MLTEFVAHLQYLFPKEINCSGGGGETVNSKDAECSLSQFSIAGSCDSQQQQQQQQLESATESSGQVMVTPLLYLEASLSSDVHQPALFQSICKSGFYDSSKGRDLQLEQLLGLSSFNLTFLKPNDTHHYANGNNEDGGGENESQSWSAVLLAGGKVTWYLWSIGIDSALRRSKWHENASVPRQLFDLKSRCLVHEIEQQIGEVLFVPDGYNAIAVASKEEGAMILTQPVCKWINTESRLQRLGYVVYGNEVDDHRGYGLHRFHHYPDDAMPKKVYKAGSKVPIFD